MARILVDTNVVSYRHKQDTRAALYEPLLVGHNLLICFETVAELYEWAIAHRWGAPRVQDLRETLADYLLLPYDDATAWRWAEVRTIKGRPIDIGDAWIAATALRHNLPLVTHNRRHFEQVPGLQVISAAP